MASILQNESLFRRLLLLILVLGMLGTGVELFLLGHTEDFEQWIPLILLASGLVATGVWIRKRTRWSLRVFQVLMALSVLAGPVGIWHHYESNVEFELEMSPAMAGLELFREAMTGAMPALAPGTMMQLGLLGLLYAFRHPVFNPKRLSYEAEGEQP